MTDDLVGRLRAWSPLIASGYECPAAAQPMGEAAARIEALEAALDTVVVNLRRHHPESHGPVPMVIAFASAVRRGETMDAAMEAAHAALTPKPPHAD